MCRGTSSRLDDRVASKSSKTVERTDTHKRFLKVPASSIGAPGLRVVLTPRDFLVSSARDERGSASRIARLIPSFERRTIGRSTIKRQTREALSTAGRDERLNGEKSRSARARARATPENKNERIRVGTEKKDSGVSLYSFCSGLEVSPFCAVQGKGEMAAVCKIKNGEKWSG